jgi:hypothetical protein
VTGFCQHIVCSQPRPTPSSPDCCCLGVLASPRPSKLLMQVGSAVVCWLPAGWWCTLRSPPNPALRFGRAVQRQVGRYGAKTVGGGGRGSCAATAGACGTFLGHTYCGVLEQVDRCVLRGGGREGGKGGGEEVYLCVREGGEGVCNDPCAAKAGTCYSSGLDSGCRKLEAPCGCATEMSHDPTAHPRPFVHPPMSPRFHCRAASQHVVGACHPQLHPRHSTARNGSKHTAGQPGTVRTQTSRSGVGVCVCGGG